MSFLMSLNATLIATLGPAGPVMVLGGLGLVMIVATLPFMLNRGPDPFAKLKDGTAPRGASIELGRGDSALRRTNRDKLDRFAQFLEPQNQAEMSAARLRMVRAGYRGKNAVRLFHAAQFALGIGGLLLGLVLALLKSKTGAVSGTTLAIYALLPGVAGYYAPQYWVQRRLQERQQKITEGFPDALDMMLVCVEAGQSLDHSILRVARETRDSYPPLAEELEIVAHEVKAGKERITVLKDMAERVGLTDVSTFVTTLVQSATFGTSIAEALRIYSAEMRDKRVMRAEEKANTLPTKMTLGTMLFTVPPLMLMLIGPSIYGIVKTLSAW